MGTGAITAYVDVAQLVLYAFWIFFFGLIFYLIRENHREGYPLDNDRGLLMEGWPRVGQAKTYLLHDGREVVVPRPGDGPEPLPNAERTHRFAGSPIEPVGNPLLAGVGPGSWSSVRPDEPELDLHHEPKIVPLSHAEGFGVASRDPDPRGKPVVDARGDVAGTVVDLWIDRGEMMFRYLEVEVPLADGGTRRVLTPMTFARITDDGVTVHAILAEQFAAVPGLKSTTQITMLEEERITAYYGAGSLYADERRADPFF